MKINSCHIGFIFMYHCFRQGPCHTRGGSIPASGYWSFKNTFQNCAVFGKYVHFNDKRKVACSTSIQLFESSVESLILLEPETKLKSDKRISRFIGTKSLPYCDRKHRDAPKCTVSFRFNRDTCFFFFLLNCIEYT